jgi:hypothetical protein
MKNLRWLVIGIIFYTAAVLIWPPSNLSGALFSEIIIVSAIIFTITIGYFMIYMLEKKEIYNAFAAVLMSSMPVIALSLIVLFILPAGWGYFFEALFPFLLLGSSLGGIWAHKKRLKQHAQNYE